MANTIKIKNSGISNNAPTSLEFGELGLNYADGKIFFKNLSNTIVEFSTPPNFVIQSTAPANTSVIWADTSVTGVGVVPVGGTTGQVLSKGSNTSYDAVWANVVSSSDLALKANIASPTFTGTVTIPAGASISGFAPLANAALTGVPTAPTANAATNTTQIATTAFVRTEVANLVASAPVTLDTLDELAAALGDDANFATTTATAIGLKAPLASPTFTGTPTLPTGTIATTQSAGNSTTSVATTAFVTTAASNVLGFRNVLINGGFDIWQRGTSYSSATSGYLTADRWYTNQTSNTVISQESSDLPAIGVQYGIKYVTSGSGYAQFYQGIEADNIRKYKGQTVTVSAYVKVTSNYVGTLYCNIDWSSTTDLNTGMTTSLAGFAFGNGANATGWTRFTGTFTVPSNVAGLRVGFVPDSSQGSGVTVRIAGVQLEFGSIASAFESRSYGMELALCQRYYEISNGVCQVTAGATGFGGNTYFSWIGYKVEKRIALGMVTNNTSNGVRVYATDGGADYITYWKAATQYYSNAEGFEIATTQGFGMVTSAGGQTDAGLGRFYWYANAEL